MTTGIINKKRYFFVFLMTASINLYATSWKSDRSDNTTLEQYQSDRRFAYPIIPESQNHHFGLRHEDHRVNADFQCDKAKKSSWSKMEHGWDYVYSEGDVNKNCFEFKKYPCLSRDTLQIISKPVVSIEKDETYKYQVIAKSNNENAKHIYSLSHAPKGMKIDPHSGLIVWKPTEDYYPPSANTPLSCSKIKHNSHDAIYYSDFSDSSAIKLNGRSRKLNSMAGKPILQLTDGSLQSSHILFKNPIRLASGSGFTSAFSFQNTNPVKFHSYNKQSRSGISLIFRGENDLHSEIDGDIDDDMIHEALKIEFNTK